MEVLILILVILCVVLPIVAIAKASSASIKMRGLETRLDEQGKEIQGLKDQLEDTTRARKRKPVKVEQEPEAAVASDHTAEPEIVPEADTDDKTPEVLKSKRPKIAASTASASIAQSKLRAASTPPRNFVFTDENKERFGAFIRNYWLYILGALTLMLSGVYMVRWGIENGFVPPILRVLFALALGAGLLYVAEVFRRKGGDEKGDWLEYMPSSIASAGVATIYAAIFGAHGLYGLIGSLTAFVAMFLTALGTIVLGLRFGLLLSALGVLGAYMVPFLVGGDAEQGHFLFAYALLIMVAAMVVDSFRRSAWLSVFAMIAAFGFSSLIYMGAPSRDLFILGYMAFGFLFLVFGVVIPERNLTPNMAGMGVLEWLRSGKKSEAPDFPTRLAALGMMGAMAVVVLVTLFAPSAYDYISIWYFFVIAMMGFYWLGRAPALQDLILIILGVGLFLVLQAANGFAISKHALWSSPLMVIVLMGLVLGLSCALASLYFTRFQKLWGLLASLYPFAMFGALLLGVNVQIEIGDWIRVVMIFLAYAAVLVAVFNRFDGMRTRPSEFAALTGFLYAFVMLALWSFETESLEGMLIGTFALFFAAITCKVRFEWRYVGWFGAGALTLLSFFVMTTGMSVFQDIGYKGSGEFPLWKSSYLLVAAGAYFWVMNHFKTETRLRVQLEGWIWVFVPFALLIAYRQFTFMLGINTQFMLASQLSLLGALVAFGVHRRMKSDDSLNGVRKLFYFLYAGASLFAAGMAWSVLNPLFTGERIAGWPLLNALSLSYLPLLALGYFALRHASFGSVLPELSPKARKITTGVFSALLLIMLNRQFWQGKYIDLSRPNSMGETASYTVMLIVATLVFMAMSLRTREKFWRVGAISLLLLTAAKVYFVDLTHTAGITRVLVLFVFGAILLGFNYVDRNSKPVNELPKV